MFNNANNGSTSSLSSLQDERPERKRHQGWRKPVPKFIPDPPKQHSLLSNASALRRMALLTSGDERPPVSFFLCSRHTVPHADLDNVAARELAGEHPKRSRQGGVRR